MRSGLGWVPLDAKAYRLFGRGLSDYLYGLGELGQPLDDGQPIASAGSSSQACCQAIRDPRCVVIQWSPGWPTPAAVSCLVEDCYICVVCCTTWAKDCEGVSCYRGACRHWVAEPGTGCRDDGNACTADYCQGAVCTHPQIDCDDDNVCNGMETCDPASGCQPGQPLECDDGNACNGTETCDPASGCQSGEPPD